MSRTSGPLARHLLVLLLVAVIGFITSGCLWGVVTDANTGAPLRNVDVTYVDANGQTLSTTTDVNGIYVFDQASGPYPARGSANVTVDAAGYEPMTAVRLIEYNENPNASFANLSSFWEVQNLLVTPPTNRYHSEVGKFSITFPADWEVESEEDFIGGFAPFMSDDAPAACAVQGMPIPGEVDLDLLISLLLIRVKGNVRDFKEISRTQAQLDLAPAIRQVISYKATITGDGQSVELSFKDLVYFAQRADMLYLFDCSTLAERFPGRQLVFEELAKGFRTD